MIEYTYDVQKLFLEMMMHDAQSFLRVQNIFNEENFDRDLRETAKFIYDHANEHKTLPDRFGTWLRAVARTVALLFDSLMLRFFF